MVPSVMYFFPCAHFSSFVKLDIPFFSYVGGLYFYKNNHYLLLIVDGGGCGRGSDILIFRPKLEF